MKKRNLLIIILTLISLALIVAASACSCGGRAEKIQLAKENVVFNNTNGYTYTGKPIEPQKDIHVLTPDGKDMVQTDFSFSYSDNTDAGIATATITATEENEYYFGSVSLNFTIKPTSAIAYAISEITTFLASPNYDKITVMGSLDFTGMDITVREGVTVTIQATTGMAPPLDIISGDNFTNNGKIVVESAMNGYHGTNFFISGNFTNNGEISLGGEVDFYNGGKLTNNGSITVLGSPVGIYTNDEEIPNLLYSGGGSVRQNIRKKISESNIVVSEKVVYSPEGSNKLKFDIKIDGKPDTYVAHTAEYRDNDRAGTAYADIKVRADDKNLYGELTYPYTIERAAITVEDIEELQLYQATGNYGVFTMADGKLTVPAGEKLVLEEGNSLTVGSAEVYGEFENFGTFTCFDDKTTYTIEGLKILKDQNATEAGALKNYGIITVSHFSASAGATFENNGIFKAEDNAYFSAFMKNGASGEMDINSAAIYADIENSGSIVIRGGAYSVIASETISVAVANSGTIKANGDIVLYGGISLTGTPIENLGTVWAYSEVAGGIFSGKVVVKRHLQLSDIVLENPKVTYDGSSHSIRLADEVGLPAGTYTVKYKYADGYSMGGRLYPVDAGKINITITVNSNDTPYFYGDKVENILFEIEPIEITVNTAIKFCSAASNRNYGKIISDANLSLPSSGYSSLRIREEVTLDLNGHTVSINCPFENRGTILNNKPLAEDYTMADCGIIVKEKQTFTNSGIIENGNILYIEANAKLLSTESGIIKNRGIIFRGDENYFNCAVENIDGGTEIVRENLSDLTKDSKRDRIYLDYYFTPYDGTEKEPNFHVLNKNDIEVSDKDSRFSWEYIDNTNASFTTSGMSSRIVITAADPFDREFMGSASISFGITRSEKVVYNSAQLAEAVQDINYAGYKLSSYGNVFNIADSFTMRSDAYIDIGELSLVAVGSAKIDFSNGELWASARTYDRIAEVMHWADKITLLADISGNRELKFATYYRYSNNDYANIIKNKPFTNINLDLNGHSLLGQITFTGQEVDRGIKPSGLYYDYTLKIYDSSDGKTGVIGNGTSPGMTFKTASLGAGHFSVVLDGIKVRGGTSVGNGVNYSETGDTDTEYGGE